MQKEKRHGKSCRVCGIDLTTKNMYESREKKSDWICKKCHYEQKDNNRQDRRLKNTMLYIFWADEEPLYIGSSAIQKERIRSHIKGKSQLKRDIEDWRNEGLTKVSYHVCNHEVANPGDYSEDELENIYILARDKMYTLEYLLIRKLEPRLNKEYNRYCDFKLDFNEINWDRYVDGFINQYLYNKNYWDELSIDDLEFL